MTVNQLFSALGAALQAAAASNDNVTAITGAGAYFTRHASHTDVTCVLQLMAWCCSGNDIANFLTKESPATAAANAAVGLRAFVGTLIDLYNLS